MDNDSPAAANRLTAAMSALADVLDAENQALAAVDHATSEQLAAAKQRAIATLEAAVGAMPPDPAAEQAPVEKPPLEQARGGKALRADLHAAETRLAATLTENRIRLAEAIAIQQRAIGTVLAAAGEQLERRNYGPRADVEPAGSIRGVSLTTRV